MSNQRPSLTTNRNNKKASSSKNNKKSNITLAVDTDVIDTIKNISEGEGLSINSKINSILCKYTSFYKYVEQDSSLIIPSRSVKFFIENIDEEKWIQEYSNTLEEIIPLSF